jgi:hypothetical protein
VPINRGFSIKFSSDISRTPFPHNQAQGTQRKMSPASRLSMAEKDTRVPTTPFDKFPTKTAKIPYPLA